MLLLVGPCLPVHAGNLLDARRLMKSGDFEAAHAAFLPLAAAGNADAEELIGVLYAMGPGVERDDERALDWYLRAAMKGHPGAQSGVGWYYEIGRGMPAPDLASGWSSTTGRTCFRTRTDRSRSVPIRSVRPPAGHPYGAAVSASPDHFSVLSRTSPVP